MVRGSVEFSISSDASRALESLLKMKSGVVDFDFNRVVGKEETTLVFSADIGIGEKENVKTMSWQSDERLRQEDYMECTLMINYASNTICELLMSHTLMIETYENKRYTGCLRGYSIETECVPGIVHFYDEYKEEFVDVKTSEIKIIHICD